MSVQDIINEIVDRIEGFENGRGFHNYTGSNQVENQTAFMQIEYGKYSELVSLYEELTNSTWVTDQKYFHKRN